LYNIAKARSKVPGDMPSGKLFTISESHYTLKIPAARVAKRDDLQSGKQVNIGIYEEKALIIEKDYSYKEQKRN
jgi:hypothetical protein